MNFRFEWVIFGVTMAALLLFFVANAQETPDKRIADTMAATSINDDMVTNSVMSALRADPGLNSLSLKVKTRKGKVQLIGSIDTEAQIDHAIALVRGVSGVRGIKIKIDSKGQVLMAENTSRRSVVATRGKSVLSAGQTITHENFAAVPPREMEAGLGDFADDQIQGAHVADIPFGIVTVSNAGNANSFNR